MDCKTAHLLLDFARPQPTELEASEAEALDNHLLDCPACARAARDERALDAHLGMAMRDVPIPAGLRERLLHGLQGELVSVRRHRIVRAGWSLAAAAAFLFVVWLGARWSTRPQAIDVAQLQDASYRELNPRREQVEEWLQARKVSVPMPEGFKESLLTDYHMVTLQGRQVPLLLFTAVSAHRHTYQARVYLLDARYFDLNDLQAKLPAADSGCKVEVLFHRNDSRYAYLVVHNADDLEPFKAADDTQLSASQS